MQLKNNLNKAVLVALLLYTKQKAYLLSIFFQNFPTTNIWCVKRALMLFVFILTNFNALGLLFLKKILEMYRTVRETWGNFFGILVYEMSWWSQLSSLLRKRVVIERN